MGYDGYDRSPGVCDLPDVAFLVRLENGVEGQAAASNFFAAALLAVQYAQDERHLASEGFNSVYGRQETASRRDGVIEDGHPHPRLNRPFHLLSPAVALDFRPDKEASDRLAFKSRS